MANFQLNTVLGYTDTNHAGDISAGNTDDGELIVDADSMSVSALRTRAAAIGGFYSTAKRLDEATVNDLRYFVRVNDHSNSI